MGTSLKFICGYSEAEVLAELQNYPDDSDPADRVTCTPFLQDCGPGMFCNHDYEDVGHCGSCEGILCSREYPSDRWPCCEGQPEPSSCTYITQSTYDRLA